MSKKKQVKPDSKKEIAKKQINPIIEAQLQNATNGIYNKRGVKSLDELFGDKRHPYIHETEEEYLNFLNEMNQTDVEEHAVKVGVLPREDRASMTRLLLREYRLRTSDYYNTAVIQPNGNKPITPEVLKILAEGR